MPNQQIKIINVDGQMIASRILKPAANVEWHTQRVQEDVENIFSISSDQYTLLVQDAPEETQEVRAVRW
ncbi:MAG: hypothetical protein VW518_05825 [Burkholderiaceae bacterium]